MLLLLSVDNERAFPKCTDDNNAEEVSNKNISVLGNLSNYQNTCCCCIMHLFVVGICKYFGYFPATIR